MRHHQKIAISRLISDLIKTDDLLCREEIDLYNHILDAYDISQEQLREAQSITLAQAVDHILQMSPIEHQKIYTILHKAALSDNLCMPREALLLQSLSLMMSDKQQKFMLYSSNSKGWGRAEKYIVYVESDYMQLINEEITEQYETIYNMLKIRNFEFIYIPKLTQSYSELGRNYLCDIIRYMNPRLNEELLNKLYERLTTLTTEQFTTDFLLNYTGQEVFKSIEPSLLVNIGSSDVQSFSVMQENVSMTNFLTIRLDNETNSVLSELKRFLDKYDCLITQPEYHKPVLGKQLFRYHGFYKQLFNFLARKDTDSFENKILIDITARRIWMRGIEIPMSSTQLATYVFILHQTLCTRYGGLLKVGQHHPLPEKELHRLGSTYYAICNLFRDTQHISGRAYTEELPNIRAYLARIRMLVDRYIPQIHVKKFYPIDACDKTKCYIPIEEENVFLHSMVGDIPFKEYPLWETLK